MIPSKWMESTIVQLSKDKKKIGNLDFMRHIHNREELLKIFGPMISRSSSILKSFQMLWNLFTKMKLEANYIDLLQI